MDRPASHAVSEFVVAVDTREQTPYLFRSVLTDKSSKHGVCPLIVRQSIVTLQTGDYSILGMESEISVERKNVDDFVQCVTRDRDRFKRQLGRLALLPHGYIMIEQEFGHLLRGRYRSETRPKSVARSMISWMHQWPTIHWLLMSRGDAELMTFRILEGFWKREGPKPA